MMLSPHRTDTVIVEAVRTPIGRGHSEKGYYRDVHPSTLLSFCYTALLERAGVEGRDIGDVVTGCVQAFGVQGSNIGRNAWLEAGLPPETPAVTVDRQCGSGQQAVSFAAALIASGAEEIVIGAGVEHMGKISLADGNEVQETYGRAFSPQLMDRYALVPQGLSAEMITKSWGLKRRELDEFAAESHARAARANEEGRFTAEMVAIDSTGVYQTQDQGIRPDTTVEVLGGLRPAFAEVGSITAGNSSQVSDGAAAILVMASERARASGVRARARIVDHLTVGSDPVLMLTGPIPATREILRRNNLKIDDIDLIEVNEAFAPVVLAWQRELNADLARVNVNGGAIALGHPLGASGARLLTSLVHELERDDKELGLVTMCCAGGLGTATLIQRV
jgi:acetyl-CoA acyltransferase